MSSFKIHFNICTVFLINCTTVFSLDRILCIVKMQTSLYSNNQTGATLTFSNVPFHTFFFAENQCFLADFYSFIVIIII